MHSSVMSNCQIPNAHRLTLLSILDGTLALQTYTCDASKVDVLSPRPSLPPQAFQNILSDPISFQTPQDLDLSNSRALLTPSVEVVTEQSRMWMYGPIGAGRPSLPPRTPSNQSPPSFQLDYDFAEDSVSNPFSSYAYISTNVGSPCSTCFCHCPTTPYKRWRVFEKPDTLSTGFYYKHHDRITTSRTSSVTTSDSFFVTPEARFLRYGLLYRTLSESDLRPRAQKGLCRLLLSYADCWGLKTTIYGIAESLVDHAIQSGYPENYDLVSLCSTLRTEIADIWPNHRGPNVYQEYLSECFMDIFREAWVNLLARGPSRHRLLYRLCAFYAQLYVNGIITQAQYRTCFDVTNSNLRPPLALYYLNSGDIAGFRALSGPF